jgi:hypothetical protein
MDCFAALAMTQGALAKPFPTSSRRNHAVNIGTKRPEIRVLGGFLG